MLNQLIMIGRVIKYTEIDENTTIMEIAIQRTYKNKSGKYDNDYVRVEISGSMKEHTIANVSKGNLLAIKGRLENRETENLVVAEKITFLSTKSGKDD